MVKKAQNLNTSKFAPTKPYNGLPPLPDRNALETVPVLRKCVGASRALAGLTRAARPLPTRAHYRGGGTNVLTVADAIAPFGGAAFHDNKVWVMKAGEGSRVA